MDANNNISVTVV